jgi:hypothetical protein
MPLESRKQMMAKVSGKKHADNQTKMINLADLAQWNMTNMLNVCQIVNCPPPAPPKITGIENSVTPGGHIGIKGEGFTDIGYYGGTISLFIPALGTRDLSVVPQIYENWSDNLIVAQVPEGIEGVLDQNASIQVMTGDGYNSNSWQVQFRAAREVRVLPGTYNRFKLCNNVGAACDHVCYYYKPKEDWATFYGYHHTWCCVGGDSGTDWWVSQPLMNQWAIEARVLLPYEGTSGCTQSFSDDSQGGTFKVNWNTKSSGNTCRYDVIVYAVGPKGVPYDKALGQPSQGYGVIVIK